MRVIVDPIPAESDVVVDDVVDDVDFVNGCVICDDGVKAFVS